MSSCELSCELTSGEDSLERKTEERWLAEFRYSLTRGGRAEHLRRKEERGF